MEKKKTISSCYIKNPDVVMREEDDDGALLFNPDTDQIRVINSTGFFVWNLCDGNKDIECIISSVRESFDAVPKDKVSQEVIEYIDDMVTSGFIGAIENQE